MNSLFALLLFFVAELRSFSVNHVTTGPVEVNKVSTLQRWTFNSTQIVAPVFTVELLVTKTGRIYQCNCPFNFESHSLQLISTLTSCVRPGSQHLSV